MSTDTETEAPAPTDDRRAGLIAHFESALGDAVVGTHIEVGKAAWVRVTPEAWVEASLIARDKLGCKLFDFLSGIDWLVSPFGRYEDDTISLAAELRQKVSDARSAERTTGYAGGDSRFQLLAHVINTTEHQDIFLKVDVPDDTLTVPTWTSTYFGANWHEREAAEMFGFNFLGHPDPRKLYLPSEFEGFPLRKDFPLLARIVKPWPGTVDVEPMPGEEPEPDADAEGGGDE